MKQFKEFVGATMVDNFMSAVSETAGTRLNKINCFANQEVVLIFFSKTRKRRSKYYLYCFTLLFKGVGRSFLKL